MKHTMASAVLAGLALVGSAIAGTSDASLANKIGSKYRITSQDEWFGGKRVIFDFNGEEAWVVSPSVAEKDLRRPSECVANTQRSDFCPAGDAGVEDADDLEARANHSPQSQPITSRSSWADSLPSPSSSIPNETCTLFDGVARNARLNSKRFRSFSQTASWTLVDISVSA